MMDSRSTEFGGSQFCTSDWSAYTTVSSLAWARTRAGSSRTSVTTLRNARWRRPMMSSMRHEVPSGLPEKERRHDGAKASWLSSATVGHVSELFLVTGGAGFIGSPLVARLLADGARVRVLDNFSAGTRANLAFAAKAGKRLEVIRGDIRNRAAVERAARGARVIFHQAAMRSVPRSVKDPLGANENNVTGTLNVLQAARRCRPLEVHGDGTQSRDFTYIDNVVEANVLAARAPGVGGEVFNVGCGERVSLLAIVAKLEASVGRRLERKHTPLRSGDVPHTLADLSKAKRLLGYAPLVGFDEGLRRTVDYFRTLTR